MRYLVSAALLTITLTACSADPTESDEYRELEQAAEEDAATITDLEERLEQFTSFADNREARLQGRYDDLETQQAAAEKVRKDLLRLANQLERRERAVGIVESEIARRTVGGDGVYRVGRDMEPGTYRSADNGDGCYSSVNADANGDDIITNNLGAGPQLVTVSEGQYFETSGCDDWVRQ